jgi:hypothetical protein
VQCYARGTSQHGSVVQSMHATTVHPLSSSACVSCSLCQQLYSSGALPLRTRCNYHCCYFNNASMPCSSAHRDPCLCCNTATTAATVAAMHTHTTTELRRPPRTAIECPQFDALERPDPTKFDGHHWEHIVSSYQYCYVTAITTVSAAMDTFAQQ